MSVDINNESGEEIDERELQSLAKFVLAALHVHVETDLGIILVEQSAMERLHLQWMGEPGATDVLSFPMDELRPGKSDSPTPAGLLGDVVICPEIARAQASAAGHTLQEETLMLLTHGMLHLLGFDHATPLEEDEMFGLQRELLQQFDRVKETL